MLVGGQLSGSCELCSWPGLCRYCPIRAGRMPRRNRPQSRLSCSLENSSDMPRMLVCSNHVFSEFLGSLGPLTPVSNVGSRPWSRSFWLGRGRSRHNPSLPKLLSSTDSKSLHCSVMGQQSGHGLDGALEAMAHFGTPGGVILNRRSWAMLVVTHVHSNETQWLLALSPASALGPDSPSTVGKAF